MRKSFIILISLAYWTLQTQAQGFYIYQHQITTAIHASQIDDITFSEQGTMLNIAYQTYPISQIDSVVYSPNITLDNKVTISYNNNLASVYIGARCNLYVKAQVKACDVILSSSQRSGDELTYELKGNTTNGSFLLNGEYKCTVQLNGLALTNQRGAAIDIENGKRIKIELVENTSNTLADASQGLHKACFYVKGHPEFCGKGNLILSGNSSHAFSSKEYTEFKEDLGRITITKAVKDGLHCGQYFKMKSGEVTISGTGGDCIQAEITTDSTDVNNGQIMIHNGSIHLDVTAEDVKGLKADSLITFTGGTLTAKVSGNGSKGITTDTDMLIDQSTGNTIIKISATGGVYLPGDVINEAKCMGMNVKRNLTINAGIVEVTNTGHKSKGIKIGGVYQQGPTATVIAEFDY